jgi:hypothetical protein
MEITKISHFVCQLEQHSNCYIDLKNCELVYFNSRLFIVQDSYFQEIGTYASLNESQVNKSISNLFPNFFVINVSILKSYLSTGEFNTFVNKCTRYSTFQLVSSFYYTNTLELDFPINPHKVDLVKYIIQQENITGATKDQNGNWTFERYLSKDEFGLPIMDIAVSGIINEPIIVEPAIEENELRPALTPEAGVLAF